MADALEKWIAQLAHCMPERILPVTLEIAQEWGRLSALRPIPPEDGLLAATALAHRLTFVTWNVKNVEGLGYRCSIHGVSVRGLRLLVREVFAETILHFRIMKIETSSPS